MKAIVRHRLQRGLVETGRGGLKFGVRGQGVEPQKIERWMKRHDVIESMIYAPSPTACKLLYTYHFNHRKLTSIATPSAVSYATMSKLGLRGTRSLLSPDSVPDIDMDIDSSYTQFSSFPRRNTKTHIHHQITNQVGKKTSYSQFLIALAFHSIHIHLSTIPCLISLHTHFLINRIRPESKKSKLKHNTFVALQS